MKATPDINCGSIQTKKKILCVGEILWDLLPEGAKAGATPTYSQGEILNIIESHNRKNLNNLIENLQTR